MIVVGGYRNFRQCWGRGPIASRGGFVSVFLRKNTTTTTPPIVVNPPLGTTGLLLSHVFIMLMNVIMPTIVGI